MKGNEIIVKGARVNNLKNIDVTIPRNKFVVITGLSGSGKSSLAFDTLYAEGQRRYVESLSSYARQFLGRMSKPECDFIKGLPPAIAALCPHWQDLLAREWRASEEAHHCRCHKRHQAVAQWHAICSLGTHYSA